MSLPPQVRCPAAGPGALFRTVTAVFAAASAALALTGSPSHARDRDTGPRLFWDYATETFVEHMLNAEGVWVPFEGDTTPPPAPAQSLPPPPAPVADPLPAAGTPGAPVLRLSITESEALVQASLQAQLAAEMARLAPSSDPRDRATRLFYDDATQSFVEMALNSRGVWAPLGDDDFAVASGIPRELIDYAGPHGPNTIYINTAERRLYYVYEEGRAVRYGVGVGREGFEWSGSNVITRKAEWPTWTPPAAMVARDPNAAPWAAGMPGGLGNPLGARALYIGTTLYRIHGTNDPSTIGHAVSSGCIRLTNEDIVHLYSMVSVGTRVVVE